MSDTLGVMVNLCPTGTSGCCSLVFGSSLHCANRWCRESMRGGYRPRSRHATTLGTE